MSDFTPPDRPAGSTSGLRGQNDDGEEVITNEQIEAFREQDLLLPIANIHRVMKSCLPTDAKISKEAKELVQECVSEFISFVTSEAAEATGAERRKLIAGEDIMAALDRLDLEEYGELLKIYLVKYRAHEANTKTTTTNRKGKKRAAAADDE